MNEFMLDHRSHERVWKETRKVAAQRNPEASIRLDRGWPHHMRSHVLYNDEIYQPGRKFSRRNSGARHQLDRQSELSTHP